MKRVKDDGRRLADALWAKIQPLLSARKAHPLGCHNPRVPDRSAMESIFCVLRTGCQWGALDATGICSHASAHRRFLEWTKADVFEELWRRGLLAYDEFVGLDWDWLAMDRAMTKAPPGGKKAGPNPTDRAKKGTKRSLPTEAARIPIGLAVDGANRNDFKMARETLEGFWGGGSEATTWLASNRDRILSFDQITAGEQRVEERRLQDVGVSAHALQQNKRLVWCPRCQEHTGVLHRATHYLGSAVTPDRRQFNCTRRLQPIN